MGSKRPEKANNREEFGHFEMEFAEHETIAKAFNTAVYFTYPYSSWEKGQIEYFNKLFKTIHP